MQPSGEPAPSSIPDNLSVDLPARLAEPAGQPGAPETPPPPVGTTPPATLVAQAAQGRRGAAWRLFHWISEDNREAIEAVRSCPDAHLLQYFLEWLALGTWAGKPFKIPSSMRQPHFRTQIRTLFLPGPGASAELTRQVLCSGLGDRRPEVREAAAHLLGMCGDPAAAPNLTAALSDEKSEVRVQAAKALGRLHLVGTCPALVSAFNAHDEALAGQAQHALLQFGPQAAPALLAGARSRDPWVRWHALHALGELNDMRAQPALVAALADNDHAVAWMAARALAPMGTPAVVPVLELLVSAPTTAWLMETAAYVLRQQHNQQLRPILGPVIQSMHAVDYRITAPMAAERALEQLAGSPTSH